MALSIIPLLLKEMEQEVETTRKMLSRVPSDKFDWKPHEKSMSMKELTTHIADLPSWVKLAVTTDELDFAKVPYNPPQASTAEDLITLLNKAYEEGYEALKNAKEEDLEPGWTMRNGEEIYLVCTKYELVRVSLAQTAHHRAQLGVYLRLLNIPIPGSYGPSADEMQF